MARIETDPNYTAPTFSRATAPTDLFKKEDVQNLAAAVSTHTHGAGLGLPIAAGAIPAGTITSAMIQDGAITAADIADGQITSAKIADGSITGADIAAGAITSAQIADGTITGADIAAGAIGSAQIADGSIATADIGDGQITSAKLAANIAISGTLSVAGATTFTGIVNASSILMTPAGVIRMGPAAAQQSGGLNLANSNPVSWRNSANTADVSIIIDSTNHLSLVGWADDGGSFTPAGAAPNALRIIINGVAWRAPLYPMP